MHSEARSTEHTLHLTMKTARPTPPLTLAHANPHATAYQHRTSKPNTPLSSPKAIHPVGQAYPAKLSPASRPSSVTTTQEHASASTGYFGLLVEQSMDTRESVSTAPLEHRGSGSLGASSTAPTATITAYSAAIPKSSFLPLDANPAYDTFRLQAEANQSGKMFALGGFQLGKTAASRPLQPSADSASSPFKRPRPLRTASQQLITKLDLKLDTQSDAAMSPGTKTGATTVPVLLAPSSVPQAESTDSEMTDAGALATDTSTTATTSSSSSVFPVFPELPRYESPTDLGPADPAQTISPIEDRHPRLSLTLGKISPPSSACAPVCARADSVPSMLEEGPKMMEPAQLRDILATQGTDSPTPLLLLDVRVSTYFAASRIRGALNLCIPTTLLKRATFNLQKMQLTFARNQDQETFSAWKETRYLVVYDSSSVEKRDATGALNMLRKFTAEGYKGEACVLRGGFRAFEGAYPDYINDEPPLPADDEAAASGSGCTSLSLGPSNKRPLPIAPIIGGVMLPAAASSPDPFFSNIRQNMDLADGVGRIHIAIPANLDPAILPLWLREATDPLDEGDRVSQRFLSIEVAEQSRMKQAYSAFNTKGLKTTLSEKVVLSGIEKGTKNRYKDILPFDHARVRLLDRPQGACDYINASHLQASRSLKRYIASQGPLPSTFNDFWSVVWDQDVRVIVMLTAESEGGQLKCHPYWTASEYGPIRLRLVSEQKVSLDAEKPRRGGPDAAGNGIADFRRQRASTLAFVGGLGSAGLMRSDQQPNGVGAEDGPYVTVRKFALSNTKHACAGTREVTQVHYASWPDFGAPAKPSHLLAIVDVANSLQNAAATPGTSGNSMNGMNGMNGTNSTNGTASRAVMPPYMFRAPGGSEIGRMSYFARLGGSLDGPETDTEARPMLVHCSAGCGRTGTFCTVDAVLDMLKRQRQGGEGGGGSETRNSTLGWLSGDAMDLVAKTVEDFRSQRLSMVQSLRQFVLCYETVTEWVVKRQERQENRARGPGHGRSESVQVPFFR